MTEVRRLHAKVCLVGDQGSGKTELISRYVQDTFDNRYITSLGAKVSKKELVFDDPAKRTQVRVDMTIWDIMGAKGFRDLLKEAYFHGTMGVLAVADITRYDTLKDLPSWVEAVFDTVGEVPVVLAVNKVELRDRAAYGDEQVRRAAEALHARYFYTSTKTGENVEAAFRTLAERIVAYEGASDARRG